MARYATSFLRRRARHGAAFLYGAAHALDLGGVMTRNRGRFGRGCHGDAQALRHDWELALGGDWLPPLDSSRFGDGEA